MQTKKMILAAVIVFLAVAGGAMADMDITIETVSVGDAGNAADTRYKDPSSYNGNGVGFGAVSYTYNIGKYEVTAGQYTAFLNAVAATDTYNLYKTNMAGGGSVYEFGCNIKRTGSSGSYRYSVTSDYANRPVNYVNFWDACRFANWLQNGQPTGLQGAGTTETGTYTLKGYNGPDGRTIQRNPGATWAVASEDEWYKAAYYKGGSTNAGYWDYPTCSNTPPGNDLSDASGNNGNYYTGSGPYPIDNGHYTTVVGQFQNSASPYGTFDQGGNVMEWNEGIPFQNSSQACRGLRGGMFSYGYSADDMLASIRAFDPPHFVDSSFGFRVSNVPEPCSLALLALSGLAMLRRRK